MHGSAAADRSEERKAERRGTRGHESQRMGQGGGTWFLRRAPHLAGAAGVGDGDGHDPGEDEARGPEVEQRGAPELG